MEELLEILEEVKPGVDFENTTGLVTDGILDSFAIISLVTEIGDELDVEIPVEEIVTENFDSAEAILALINRLSE